MTTHGAGQQPRRDETNYYEQVWSPCTQHEKIESYLGRLRFPVSYRVLCEQWRALGKPHLVSLKYPEGLHYGTRSDVPLDLEVLSSLQELMTLSILAGYIREAIVPPQRPFSEFASHVHIFCSVKVEMAHMLYQLNREQQQLAYERQWHALQANFHHDRAFCSSIATHDCIGFLLYGEVYHLSNEIISTRYQTYHFNSFGHLQQPFPMSISSSSLDMSQQPQQQPSTVVDMPHPSTQMQINGGASPYPNNVQLRQTAIPSPSNSTFSRAAMEPPRDNIVPATLPLSLRPIHIGAPAHWQPTRTRDGLQTSMQPLQYLPPDAQYYARAGSTSSSVPSTSTGQMHQMVLSPVAKGSRAEQNRQKSKRHYEKKKSQRALLYELTLKLEATVQLLEEQEKKNSPITISVRQVLASTLPMPEYLFPPSSSLGVPELPASANEKKKLNKKVQNHLEMQRMVQLSKIAELLASYDDSGRRTKGTSEAISRSVFFQTYSQASLEAMHPRMLEPLDALILDWLRFRDHWDELNAAEHRLSKMEHKPIAKLVSILTALTATNRSSSSSTSLLPTASSDVAGSNYLS